MFGVRKNFKLDLDAARTLGITQSGLRQSTDRLSAVEVGAIDNNIFRPINISPDIQQAFAENAARIGEVNPFISAQAVIANIQQQLSSTSLLESEFPLFENPLLPSAQETPVTPNTLNLPAPDTAILANSGTGSGFNNLTTAQKLEILFGRS